MSDFPKPTVKRAGIKWTIHGENRRTCTHNGVDYTAARRSRDAQWCVTEDDAPYRVPVRCHSAVNLSACVLQMTRGDGKVAPPAKA